MNVLVVRPAPACFELVEMCNNAGLKAMAAPLLSFKESKSLSSLNAQITALPPKSIIVAVSPRAIEFANKVLKQQAWRKDLTYVAIGKRSAQCWQELAKVSAITPRLETSEGLLSLSIFHKPNDRNILILRGNGGRTFLADELKQLGAKVCYFETYQRVWDSQSQLAQSKLWLKNEIKTLIITSGEQLSLLWGSANQKVRFWLIQCQLFVPSQRLYQQAKSLGFKTVINVDSATNQALFNALYNTKILDKANDRD